jgi:hypothetical protein
MSVHQICVFGLLLLGTGLISQTTPPIGGTHERLGTLMSANSTALCQNNGTEVCVGVLATPYMGTYHWSIVGLTQDQCMIQSWYPAKKGQFWKSFVTPAGVPGRVRYDDPILGRYMKNVRVLDMFPVTWTRWLEVTGNWQKSHYSPYHSSCADYTKHVWAQK